MLPHTEYFTLQKQLQSDQKGKGMLVKLDDISGLICPKSGLPLQRQDELFETEDKAISYKVIDGFPVLVDFDSSVLEQKNYKDLAVPELVERQNSKGFKHLVKSIISPPKKITEQNVKQLFDLLSTKRLAQVLVIGGGTVGQNMHPFYESPHIELHSFDIYSSANVQFVADAHSIPFENEKFDLVIIQAVLEHVLEPQKVVDEIWRVLKSDGLAYSETPFLQHVHEGPYDFTRFTESGHRYLYKNFELINSGFSAGAGTTLLWAIDNFSRGLFRSRIAGKVIKLMFIWLNYLDNWIPEKYNIDAANGCFFLGKKSQTSITPKDAIAHYNGAQ
jgi:Methyltransferase domain